MSVPTLPDSVAKFALLIGILLTGYSFFMWRGDINDYLILQRTDPINVASLNIDKNNLTHKLDKLEELQLSRRTRFRVTSNMLSIDSLRIITKDDTALTKFMITSDSISTAIEQTKQDADRLSIKTDSILNRLLVRNTEGEVLSNKLNIYLIFMALGIIFIFYGLRIWNNNERTERTNLIRQNIDKPTYSDCCQSCGRIFNSVVTYGDEITGIKNYHFCKACYTSGAFAKPDLTVDDIISSIKVDLKTRGNDEKNINKIVERIRRLDRWNPNRY